MDLPLDIIRAECLEGPCVKALIVDGYNDEPGGLGVPPYIDVYPRLVAGSIWLVDKSSRVDYITVDQFRRSEWLWIKRASKYDLVVFIAGVVVPGRYIGGVPAGPEELSRWAGAIEGPIKILVGPAARWGMGLEGGKPAYPPHYFAKAGFDVLVRGDVEEYFYDLARHGVERASPLRLRKDYKLYDKVARIGARIIRQHPRLGWGLIAEIETYRGCARWVSGGCSFCVEPLRGKPVQRDPRGIIKEIEALYRWGVLAFRLGRQADILVYGSKDLAVSEWPRPDPDMLRRLFHGIRAAAPGLEVLHIDNVNPGTIAKHPDESLRALKVIVEYHTDGDVAAMGIETADPRVAKINNLNTDPGEAMLAIELVNKVGRERGPSGLPHLLPGINFILGLPGETSETYRLNRRFLEEILQRDLMVRRVNIRRLLPIPLTRVYKMKHGVKKRNEKHARSFVHWVRNVFDREMLRRIAPPGTIISNVWIEECEKSYCYGRQTGSYPLTILLPCDPFHRHELVRRVLIVGVHSARSLKGVPIPLHPMSRRKIVELAAKFGVVKEGPSSYRC